MMGGCSMTNSSPYSFIAFGAEDFGWDTDSTGRPGVGLVGTALSVWTTCQGRPVTVREAADAFRLPLSMILEAVDQHIWMYLDHQGASAAEALICHDGE